jgi:hypothetical protein
MPPHNAKAQSHSVDRPLLRYGKGSAPAHNGKILIVGGALTSASDPVATAEIYDPATGTFTMTGAMATAREQHTATLLADGRVLIVGGDTIAKRNGFASRRLSKQLLGLRR